LTIRKHEPNVLTDRGFFSSPERNGSYLNHFLAKTTKEIAMFGRREPPLTEIMRRIFSAAANTRKIIADWVRDEKELSDEPVVGRHVLGGL
jgi:hypothetical protein